MGNSGLTMNSQMIDAFEHGTQKVRAAITGLTPPQLQLFPVPGTWSIHQIVVHLADADLARSDRMKRIIAMDNPILQAWDQSRFAQRLHYHEQSLEDALAMMELDRKQMARILRRLPESAFARKGMHTESGELTLAQMLDRGVRHVDHHLKFIRDKRAMIETLNKV
jgi:hypothetical protein